MQTDAADMDCMHPARSSSSAGISGTGLRLRGVLVHGTRFELGTRSQVEAETGRLVLVRRFRAGRQRHAPGAFLVVVVSTGNAAGAVFSGGCAGAVHAQSVIRTDPYKLNAFIRAKARQELGNRGRCR